MASSSRQFMSSMSVAAQADEQENHFALILGKPGGGKGTISGKILKVCTCRWQANAAFIHVVVMLTMSVFCFLQDFPQFHHVSSGDLLRSHVRDGTELGVQARKYMEDGQLVPDELMIGLVMHEATPHLDNGKSLLLDGFPRTVTQAKALEEVVHVDLVINLDIPTETIVERIADR